MPRLFHLLHRVVDKHGRPLDLLRRRRQFLGKVRLLLNLVFQPHTGFLFDTCLNGSRFCDLPLLWLPYVRSQFQKDFLCQTFRSMESATVVRIFE